jgi:GAF domain-containing protein/HAMP domain-containing protein
MNQSTADPQEAIQRANRRLSESLIANGMLASMLAVITAIAIAAVFALTQTGLIAGGSSAQLLGVALATLLIAGGFVLAVRLARQGRGLAGQNLVIASVVAFSIVVTGLWQGAIVILLIAIIWSQAALVLVNGLPRRALLTPVAISAVGTALTLLLEFSLPYPRLQVDNLATNVTVGFLISMAVLLFVTILIANSQWFRKLQNRLILTSLVSITAPLIATSVIFGINGFTSTQDQINNSLLAITSLKAKQIDQLIVGFQEDILRIERNFELNQSTQYILQGSQDPVEASRNRTVVLAELHDFQVSEEENYKDIWILNSLGEIVISTTVEDQGSNYGNQAFFQNGKNGFSVSIPVEAPFNRNEILIVSPVLELRTGNFLGVIVIRADLALLRNIMETTPGLPFAQTYMIGLDFTPITEIQAEATDAEKQIYRDAIMSGEQSDDGIYAAYPNFGGETVLGYFRWYQPLQVMMVAEIPQSVVFQSLLSTVVASILTGLFGIAITLVAIMISARSISDPIQRLDQSAQNFANGDLSSRGELVRQDEVGNLTRSFNLMADRLQDVIGNLEQRVSDRTLELEQQSLRLLAAAEIARDAASARNLDELLNRAARLIRDRFGFYHSGIFLMDKNNEYAVLSASPTEAGRTMIANRHQLRVGEVGIVGYVASTGQPRIALDTGQDAAFFDNPLLPKTRSEMALPLIADNVIIGVLDVQSDQPQAFSQEDISIMQVMADQLATAIEKARLLNELQENLKELERASQQNTREGWKEVAGKKGLTGYHFDKNKLDASSEVPDLAKAALNTGSIAYSTHAGENGGTPNSAAIPVKLRGQTIGALNVQFLGDKIPEETVRMIESVADRLAIAVENARLVQDSQRRASLEYTISQMSNKIGAASEVDSVLKATAQELGKLLPDTAVSVHLIGTQDGAAEGARE